MGVIPFAFRHCMGCEVGQQWGATPAHRAESAQGCKPEQGNASAMSIEWSHCSGQGRGQNLQAYCQRATIAFFSQCQSQSQGERQIESQSNTKAYEKKQTSEGCKSRRQKLACLSAPLNAAKHLFCWPDQEFDSRRVLMQCFMVLRNLFV